jgi:hypothetical protein
MGTSRSSMLGGGEWRGYIGLVCRRAALAGRVPTRSCSTLVTVVSLSWKKSEVEQVGLPQLNSKPTRCPSLAL